MYQTLELVSLVAVLLTIYVMLKGGVKNTIEDEKTFGYTAVVVVLAVVGVLSAVFRLPRCDSFIFDSLYTMSHNLEPFAILPQILLMSTHGRAEAVTGHSLFLTFV